MKNQVARKVLLDSFEVKYCLPGINRLKCVSADINGDTMGLNIKMTDFSRSKSYLPVKIDLSGSNVLVLCRVIQAGSRILRTIRQLIECTDHLTVVCLSADTSAEMLAAQGIIDLRVKEYDRNDLFGSDLVICSHDDQAVLDDVHAACKTLGIRLSILSEPWRSDYILDSE